MVRCSRCKIDIYDDTLVCPLCSSVVSVLDSSEKENVQTSVAEACDENYMDNAEIHVSHSVMYPDVTPSIRRIKFIVKLVIFLSVLVEGILIIINCNTGSAVKWSAICGAGLAYICLTLVCSVMYNRGHRRKIMFQAVCLMILAVAVDWALGFQGWSLSFAIPCTILAVDAAVFVMMIFNRDNFQTYIMMQFYAALYSIILMIVLMTAGKERFMILVFVATGVSTVMLAATVVFGDKRALSELKRRFRV